MDRDKLRRSLEKRLAELGARLAKIETHLRDPGSKDSEERAIELENEEVLERLDASERDEIAQIRAALRRIDAGRYGVCSECGGEIAQRRLETLPYTNVCVDCAG